MFFYEVARLIGVISGLPVHWLFFKRKVYYEDKKVQGRRVRGGALIISNHFCPLDYVMNVVLFFPRKLFVLTLPLVFRSKLMRTLMKFWGGIEVNQESKNPRFIIEAAKEIKNGHLVQIFPEGHNTPDGKMHPFYPSYVAIALRANAPIIPVITDGNYGIFKRTHVIIGKPINPRDYLTGEKYTKEDMLRINEIIYQKAQDLRAEIDRRIQENRKTRKEISQ